MRATALSSSSVSLAFALVVLAACASPPPPVPARPDTARYEDARSWLCLPGRDDACARDVSATELHADGTRAIERHPAATDPKLDCFYVYPTVDLGLIPGNHDDFGDLTPMTDTAVAQAVRFRESCAIYAPLYRQVTIGSYLHEDSLEPRLAFAFSDVEAAFLEYLAKYNRGRPVVLIGHSQGAEMVVRLVQRFFDGDAAMRARLVLALAIGGDVEVPAGKTVGATFANVPLCTKAGETGCVVAYRSYEAGAPMSPGRNATKPGNEQACVNPAGFEGDALKPFSRSYFPAWKRMRKYIHGLDGVETPFVELSDYYAGRCAAGPGGFRYLEVSPVNAPGDTRVKPVDLDRMPFRKVMGLHLLDYQIPQGDLVGLVAERAAAVK